MSLKFHVGFDLAQHAEVFGTVTLDIVESGVGGQTFQVGPYDTGLFFMNQTGAGSEGNHASEVELYLHFLEKLMTDLDAETGSGGYAYSFDADGRLSLEHSGGTITNVAWTPSAGMVLLLGFAGQTSLITTPAFPAYYIAGTIGFWSGSKIRERGTVATDVLSHDHTPGGLARPIGDLQWDFVVPLEEREKIWKFANAARFYTWDRLFADARNEHPIAIEDEFDAAGTTFVMLREDGAACEPQATGGDENYLARLDIPIKARILAHAF